MLLKKSRHNKRKIRAGFTASLLCTACLCFSSFATNPPSDKSNVWITAVQAPTEARISVTVPVAYGFVVVGSVESGDDGPVSVEAGNLLLPNVLVKVQTPSGVLPEPAGEAQYSIQVFSEQAIPLENYSTDVREDENDDDDENDDIIREGLPVELKAFVVALSDSTKPTHHWSPTETAPTADDADFKKFQMVLDGLPFSIPGTKNILIDDTVVSKDVINMDGSIDLPAPPDVPNNGYTAAGTANIPSQKYVDVDVKVGGRQNQYKQVEESLLVSKILWEVIPGELPPLTP